MPIIWTDTGGGVLAPKAKCGHGPCTQPEVPMVHDGRYMRIVHPTTGAVTLRPENPQFPDGWAQWRNEKGETLLLCPVTIEQLRAGFVFNAP